MRVGVLASGAGTNLQAILDQVHGREADVVAVGSDKPGARALERARDAGIEAKAFPADDYESREARDDAMGDWLVSRRVALVVLAGYMQLVSPSFLRAFPQAVINVHPALLPSFPGMRTIQRTVEHGVRVSGVTVHFVDDGVDTGPIILQRALDVPQGASAEVLHGLLQPIEHELLPEAVRLFARGAVSVDPDNPRRVLIS